MLYIVNISYYSEVGMILIKSKIVSFNFLKIFLFKFIMLYLFYKIILLRLLVLRLISMIDNGLYKKLNVVLVKNFQKKSHLFSFLFKNNEFTNVNIKKI
jgi:hypothetical protein